MTSIKIEADELGVITNLITKESTEGLNLKE